MKGKFVDNLKFWGQEILLCFSLLPSPLLNVSQKCFEKRSNQDKFEPQTSISQTINPYTPITTITIWTPFTSSPKLSSKALIFSSPQIFINKKTNSNQNIYPNFLYEHHSINTTINTCQGSIFVETLCMSKTFVVIGIFARHQSTRLKVE